MPKIKDVTNHLESIAPLKYQESYDNSGLLIGDRETEVSGVLTSLDCTEAVVDEAIAKNCNLIVSHHPIIFGGLKSITGRNYVERTVLKAIKNDISVYAIHTNLDNVATGVNKKISDILQLNSTKILSPKKNLQHLVTFIPSDHLDPVLSAIHKAGAGSIGEYEECAFIVEGYGTYVPGSAANPHLGEVGNKEKVVELRAEVILPEALSGQVIGALKNSHPYEEVAYYLSPLENKNHDIGSGMIGLLESPMAESDFIAHVKRTMNLQVLRHTTLLKKEVKKVAVCGGSGSFLISSAKSAGADVFITSDIKYHEYFDADNEILILDIGHYESEVFTKELLHDILSKKFTTFAVNLSETVTNPISYL